MQVSNERLLDLGRQIMSINQQYAELLLDAEKPDDLCEEWVSVKEASRLSGIAISTLNYYARIGRCEARKRGRGWAFPKYRLANLGFLRDEPAVGR